MITDALIWAGQKADDIFFDGKFQTILILVVVIILLILIAIKAPFVFKLIKLVGEIISSQGKK